MLINIYLVIGYAKGWLTSLMGRKKGEYRYMAGNHNEIEKRLWGAADEPRANSKLKSSEYSVPVLGLIFLRYADHKFTKAKAKLTSQGPGRRTTGTTDN